MAVESSETHRAGAHGPIFVVDDHADFRDALLDVLVDNGQEVVLAENGRDALAKLAETRPCLILLDLMMPGAPIFVGASRRLNGAPAGAIPSQFLEGAGRAIDVSDLSDGGRMRTWVAYLMLMPGVAAGQGTEPAARPPAIAAPVPVAGGPPVATTPSTAPDPTIHRHLGFFLRLDIGVGYLHSSTESRTASGVSAPLGFAIGGAVTENLIIAAEGWGSATSPSVTSNGQTVNTGAAGLAVGAFGLNITYYLMPANIYFSVTPAITALGLSGNLNGGKFGDVDSRGGFGLKLAVGKEWWVSDHWGLGLAVEFIFSSNKETGTNPPTWTTLGGGLTFSATYN